LEFEDQCLFVNKTDFDYATNDSFLLMSPRR